MNNVWLIFRRDASNLFRNVMCTIITVGLVLLPSLFAWYNILACWNVFDNTGYLSVAVANEDDGYTSDLIPIEINVGDRVVSALRANEQINWVFTSENDAIEGAKAGRYYAAIVIPDDFSNQMLTFYEGDSTSADILYYVNEKVNAISPNITGAGADALSYQVNAAFADTVSEIATALAKSASNYAEDNEAREAITRLTDHMRLASTRLGQTADILGMYASISTETGGLLSSTANLVETARTKAQSTATGINGNKQSIRDLAAGLETSLGSVSDSLANGKTALADLESKADSLLANASSDISKVAAQLRTTATDIDGKVSALSALRDDLSSKRDELRANAEATREKMIADGASEEEISAYVKNTTENVVALDETIAVLNRMIESLQKASANLTSAADKLDAAGPAAQTDIDALRQAIASAKTQLDSTVNDFTQNLVPGIATLKADIEKLATDFDGVAASLQPIGNDLVYATNGVAASLSDLSANINPACEKLRLAAQSMTKLADDIDSALAAGDTEKLKSLLANSSESIAAALSAPVQIQREALFPVGNFGSAMAPLYSALALFIGSLLIMVATKPQVSARGLRGLINPKPRQLYFGRFGVAGLLSLMQTTLLGLGNMLLLKVQVAEPLLYMICVWVAGLVFTFIIYTLVVAFGNLGKAIAVLLLIVQVTACGGSYPLPVMPDFVQALSPFVPASHVVDAFRASMFGVCQNDFWISIGKLLLFVLPFLLLGLVLRKPLEGFMNAYVSKVEESKMIE